MATIITLTKRGVGTVTMVQNTEGIVDIQLTGGIGFYLKSDDANKLYQQYKDSGYTVKFGNTEKKVASPEKPTKRFIYCKESKQIWAKEYSRKKAEMMDQIRPYFKDKAVYSQKRAELEASLKAYMKSWEASKADEVNEMLQKKWAEKNAQ